MGGGGDKIKVLITGPVNGAFTDLATKLSSLQSSKAGPFDMCFCVGPFFASSAEKDAATSPDTITTATTAVAKDMMEKGMPLPVYFCDVGTLPPGISLPGIIDSESIKDEAEISLDDDEDEKSKEEVNAKDDNANDKCPKGIIKVANNLYHLHGITTNSHGKIDIHSTQQTANILNISPLDNDKTYLTVAFIPPNTRIDTMQTSTFESKVNHPSYVGCDILLTSDWGQGMAQSSCITQQDKAKIVMSGDSNSNGNDEVGSFDIAEIASRCRPRYHVAPSILTQNEDGTSTSFFIQSLQYTNPPSAMASGVFKNYHTSRFLALCQVVDAKTQKRNGKAKKYIHALGIQPLWSMDHVTATSIPDNTIVVPSPYTDESFQKDGISSGGRDHGLNGSGSGGYGIASTNIKHGNVGLSEAQTRRILMEDGASGNQYRWNVRNNNRKRPLDATMSSGADDPSNCSLFLHGLHNDIQGGGTLNRDVISNAFEGCINVRYPNSSGGHPSYCFLDFASHEDAQMCLVKMGDEPIVAGIQLTLKWSSGRRQGPRAGPGVPPPPPPPGHVGIYAPGEGTGMGQPMQKKSKVRLTEAEAADSSSLFVHLILDNSKSVDENMFSKGIQYVGRLAQKMLVDAINADNSEEDRVTVEEEPALKVSSRNPEGAKYGFLDFASHAAASMAVATLTGHTDGGSVQQEHRNEQDEDYEEMKNLLREVQLWWAKPSRPSNDDRETSGSKFAFKPHHFPPDARTDCWFCLASPTCEKHLIVSINTHCYITMPKGPVNEHHALVVPIKHSHSTSDGEGKVPILGAFLDPTPGAVAEVVEAISKLRAYAHTELGKDLFVFERAIPTRGGYHAHINCIPVDKGIGANIRNTMFTLANSHRDPRNDNAAIELRELQNPEISVTSLLKNAEGDGLTGYFYCEIPFGDDGNEFKRFLYTAVDDGSTRRKYVPLQFGREILASVLSDQNLSHWKACVVSKEKEDEYTESFREKFNKYE